MTARAVPTLEEIFLKYRDFVYRVCYRYAKNERDAEDLLQEVFLKLHGRLPGFRGDSAVSTWIYRIAVNCCIDSLRARKSRPDMEGVELDEAVAANLGGGEDRSLAKVDMERILKQVDPRTREILFLTLAEGCRNEEAGQVVGMTGWAVAKVVSRFQEKMKNQKKAWYRELFGTGSGRGAA